MTNLVYKCDAILQVQRHDFCLWADRNWEKSHYAGDILHWTDTTDHFRMTIQMQGKNEPPEMRGIIPNSFVQVFDKIASDNSKTFLVLLIIPNQPHPLS